MPRLFVCALFCAAFVLIVCSKPAAGVVNVSGDDTSAPPSDGSIPGFYNVCYTGTPGDTTSGVYLGNNWVLSAWHTVVGLPNNEPASVSFSDPSGNYTTIPVDPGTPSVRLANPSDSSPTDLVLYRLSSAPVGLPTLQISPSRTVQFERTLFVGNGGISAGPQTHYYHVDDAANWTDSLTPPTGPLTSSDFAGLPTLSTSGPHWAHWGDNIVSNANSLVYDGYGYGPAITTRFDNPQYTNTQPRPHEAQAFYGDSGGAVFINGKLNGVIVSVTLAGGQNMPGNPALYGSQTYALDLSSYRQQIVSITGTGLIGDTNADGVVDAQDLSNVQNHLGNLPITQLVGDLNNDGRVGFGDYQIFQQSWGKSGSIGDLNHDSLVNFADFQIFESHFSEKWHELLGDTNGDGVVDATDLANVLNNMTTGTGTTILQLPGNPNGNDGAIINNPAIVSTTPIPEPSSLLLLASGILLLARFPHRRHRRPM